MPVLVLPSVVGVEMQQYMIRNHILEHLRHNSQQAPTKYLYGQKYAVYNKQF